MSSRRLATGIAVFTLAVLGLGSARLLVPRVGTAAAGLLTALAAFAPLLAASGSALCTSGTGGLRRLLSRAFAWRARPVWYAAAILGPAGACALSLAIHRVMGGPAPAYTLDLLGLVPQVLVVGLLFAVAEELGWRGWLQEGAQRLTAPLAAAVFVGLVWGGWHAPLHYLPGTVHADLPAVWFLALILAAAIAFAALYNASGRSIPVVAVAHVAFNGTVGVTVLALPAGQAPFVASSAVAGALGACVVLLATRARLCDSSPVLPEQARASTRTSRDANPRTDDAAS